MTLKKILAWLQYELRDAQEALRVNAERGEGGPYDNARCKILEEIIAKANEKE